MLTTNIKNYDLWPRPVPDNNNKQQQQQWGTREGEFEICNVGADNIGRHFLEKQQQ